MSTVVAAVNETSNKKLKFPGISSGGWHQIQWWNLPYGGIMASSGSTATMHIFIKGGGGHFSCVLHWNLDLRPTLPVGQYQLPQPAELLGTSHLIYDMLNIVKSFPLKLNLFNNQLSKGEFTCVHMYEEQSNWESFTSITVTAMTTNCQVMSSKVQHQCPVSMDHFSDQSSTCSHLILPTDLQSKTNNYNAPSHTTMNTCNWDCRTPCKALKSQNFPICTIHLPRTSLWKNLHLWINIFCKKLSQEQFSAITNGNLYDTLQTATLYM